MNNKVKISVLFLLFVHVPCGIINVYSVFKQYLWMKDRQRVTQEWNDFENRREKYVTGLETDIIWCKKMAEAGIEHMKEEHNDEWKRANAKRN